MENPSGSCHRGTRVILLGYWLAIAISVPLVPLWRKTCLLCVLCVENVLFFKLAIESFQSIMLFFLQVSEGRTYIYFINVF